MFKVLDDAKKKKAAEKKAIRAEKKKKAEMKKAKAKLALTQGKTWEFADEEFITPNYGIFKKKSFFNFIS